jgi:hypothetical protein
VEVSRTSAAHRQPAEVPAPLWCPAGPRGPSRR